MSDSTISVRYARSLFLLAKEKGIVEGIKQDMELLGESISTIPEFHYLVDSPVLKQTEKSRIFNQIFKSGLNEYTFRFFELLLKNKRENFLKDISRNFLDLCRKEKGIKSALFITALPLTASQSKDVKLLVQKAFNAEIELTEKVDEKIIGGYVLRVDDQQIDSSVSRKLESIRQELLNTIVN